MELELWRRRLRQIDDSARKLSGDRPALRNLLFGVYLLLNTSLKAVQDIFDDIPEDLLSDEGVLDLATTLTRDPPPFCSGQEDLVTEVTWAAVLLRGLEEALISLGELSRRPRRSAELHARFGEFEGWVLPFEPRYRHAAGSPVYFSRRGLRRLRCLPRQLATGHKVDLQLWAGKKRGPLTCEACLFQKMELIDTNGHFIDEHTVGNFVVRAVRRSGEALADYLGADSDVDVLVFPELSIDLDDRNEIIHLLQTRPWDPNLSGKRPALVVGGSWHEATARGHRNSAPVYDGGGNRLGAHAKHMPYTQASMHENIERAEEILVLAGPGMTVAIAICLDFCQVGRRNPYDELDVDLVLIPSLGNKKTTEHHARGALQIWDARKTAVFLAQQAESGPFGVSGASPFELTFDEPCSQPVSIRTITG